MAVALFLVRRAVPTADGPAQYALPELPGEELYLQHRRQHQPDRDEAVELRQQDREDQEDRRREGL